MCLIWLRIVCAWVWGFGKGRGEWVLKRTDDFLVVAVFFILTVVMVSQGNTLGKIQKNLHFKVGVLLYLCYFLKSR